MDSGGCNIKEVRQGQVLDKHYSLKKLDSIYMIL